MRRKCLLLLTICALAWSLPEINVSQEIKPGLSKQEAFSTTTRSSDQETSTTEQRNFSRPSTNATSNTNGITTTVNPQSKVVNIDNADDLATKISEAGDKLVVIFVMTNSSLDHQRAAVILDDIANTIDNVVILQVIWDKLDSFQQSSVWSYGVGRVKYNLTFILVRNRTIMDVLVLNANQLQPPSTSSSNSTAIKRQFIKVDLFDLMAEVSEAGNTLVVISVEDIFRPSPYDENNVTFQEMALTMEDVVMLYFTSDWLVYDYNSIFAQNDTYWMNGLPQGSFTPNCMFVRNGKVIDVYTVDRVGLRTAINRTSSLGIEPKPESKVINILTADELTTKVSEAGDKLVLILVTHSWRERWMAVPYLEISTKIEHIANTSDVVVLKVYRDIIDLFHQKASDWKYGVYTVNYFPSFIIVSKGKILDVFSNYNILEGSLSIAPKAAVKPGSKKIIIDSAEELATRVTEAGDKLVVIVAMTPGDMNTHEEAMLPLNDIPSTLDVVVLQINIRMIRYLGRSNSSWKYGVDRVIMYKDPVFIIVQNEKMIDAFPVKWNDKNIREKVSKYVLTRNSSAVQEESRVITVLTAEELSTQMSDAGDKLILIWVMPKIQDYQHYRYIFDMNLYLNYINEVADMDNAVVIKVDRSVTDLFHQNVSDWKFGVVGLKELPTFFLIKNGRMVDCFQCLDQGSTEYSGEGSNMHDIRFYSCAYSMIYGEECPFKD